MQSITRRITSKLSSIHRRTPYTINNIQKSIYLTQNKIDIKEQFDRDGFLHIPAALSHAELCNLREWTKFIETDAFEQKSKSESETNNKCRGMHHFEVDKETNQIRICRSEKLVDSHDGFHKMLYHGKVPKLVQSAMGEACILYKEKINYKYPNCGTFKPHQDAPAYPEIVRSIACAVAIDGSDEHSGCLEVAAGRHKEGVIGKNNEGIIDDNIVENIEKRNKLIYDKLPTSPGDIVLFDAYLPHRSGINKTLNSRRMLYATYNPLSEGNLRDRYYKNKEKNLKDGKVSLIFDFDGNIVST
eukprot:66813_1